jgi:hypothetical protein
MAISRRTFLGRSSVLSIAALFPLTSHARHNAGLSSGLEQAQHDLLSRLSSQSFFENLKTTFEIQVSALNTQELELIEVSKQKTHRVTESFDVLFRGRKENQFTQGTYMLHHARMGSFPVFVVPVGDGKNALYQAIFTRML